MGCFRSEVYLDLSASGPERTLAEVCVNGSYVPDAYALAKIGRIGVQIHPFRPIDEGWDEVRDGFLALFEISPELSSVMAAPRIRVVGDVAWVSGLEKFRGVLSSGDVVEVTLRTGRIFEREGEGWLVAHHQVSPPPDESRENPA